MSQAVTQSDYIKVIDYIPVPKKHQLIIPYDFKLRKYLFSDHDMRQLKKYVNEPQIVDNTIHRILTENSLNPLLSKGPKVLEFFLYFLFLVMFLLLLYLFIGIFIFFLGDPVICFMYGYFFMYQFWWRGGRVGIELWVENFRARSLERFLKKQN